MPRSSNTMHIKFSVFSRQAKFHLSREILLVFLLGFVIRLFACQYTYVVNPDGVLYIQQARAIYYGLSDNLTCGLGYLSIYTVLIAAAHAIFHNWIMAAQSVSFVFGSATLIPLYFLLKRFFDDKTSMLGTLIFALMPVFVGRSADVVRGPVCWFFLVSGLYLFIGYIERRRCFVLPLSNLCFLLATWARIEAILYVIISCLFVPFIKRGRRVVGFVVFMIPVVLVALFGVFDIKVSNIPIDMLSRSSGITAELSDPLAQYRSLRNSLPQLAKQHDGNLRYFLPEASTCIWLVALGTLLNRCLEAFFYPFFFIFVIGLGGAWRKTILDQRLLYLSLLAISATILLYLHTIRTWMLYYRFLAILILPCCVFVGYGLEKAIRFVRSKFNFNESVALSIICFVILISGLPKNLQLRGADKFALRQIGEFVSKREGNAKEIKVATSPYLQSWISFYVNLDYEGTLCLEPNYSGYWDKLASDKVRLVEKLKQKEMKYLLWEERHWHAEQSVLLENPGLRELGRWTHPDTGQMILFEVV